MEVFSFDSNDKQVLWKKNGPYFNWAAKKAENSSSLATASFPHRLSGVLLPRHHLSRRRKVLLEIVQIEKEPRDAVSRSYSAFFVKYITSSAA